MVMIMKFYFKIDFMVNYGNKNFWNCHENNINAKILMIINLTYLKYNFLKHELDMFSRDSLEYINEMGSCINMFQISRSQHTTFPIMPWCQLIHLFIFIGIAPPVLIVLLSLWLPLNCPADLIQSILIAVSVFLFVFVCVCVRAETGINPGHSIRLQSRSALVCGPEACHWLV